MDNLSICGIIKSEDIIEYLKSKNLYIRDNEVTTLCDRVSNLNNNKENSICWIRKSSYDINLLKSNIILVGQDFRENDSNKTVIFTKNPQLSMIFVLNKFFIRKLKPEISKKSYIHESAKLGKNVNVGANVVIKENCSIGDNTTINENCVIYSNTIIGSNVVLNSGVKLGQAGFGYIKDLDGNNIEFPHLGSVVIKDNVEIGSNTCVDRGALSDTVIGKYTKINNLTHIAHNVQIGENCLITANVNISGSVVISNNVYIGPNSSIMDGLKINENATIGMGSVIRKDVKSKKTMVPFSSMEKREFIKSKKKLED